jgi:hypothetical protein
MTDDAGKEGNWVTGIIGEPFQVDDQGNPIPNSPSEQPTELPSASAIWDAIDTTPPGGGLGDLLPTGILPGGSGEIGGNDDETQKEIWAAMDRGEFGPEAGSIPADAETTI